MSTVFFERLSDGEVALLGELCLRFAQGAGGLSAVDAAGQTVPFSRGDPDTEGVIMSTVVSSTIDIDAGPREVWDVLTDFAAYGEWNPFMDRIEGTPDVGRS